MQLPAADGQQRAATDEGGAEIGAARILLQLEQALEGQYPGLLPGLLPDLDPRSALEVSMIHSVAGLLDGGRLVMRPPFREPHHSASQAALSGGGQRAKAEQLLMRMDRAA